MPTHDLPSRRDPRPEAAVMPFADMSETHSAVVFFAGIAPEAEEAGQPAWALPVLPTDRPVNPGGPESAAGQWPGPVLARSSRTRSITSTTPSTSQTSRTAIGSKSRSPAATGRPVRVTRPLWTVTLMSA
jgi:hypothetical protein